jgi:hypothetical protein
MTITRLTSAEAGRISVRRGQLHDALVELEAALARPAGDHDDWCQHTTAAVEHLAWTLADHVEETDAPGGLLAEVEAAAPWLAPRVGQLRRDHELLVSRCGGLVDRCHAGVEPDELREAALELLADLTRHRHRGADLLYDAYELDVGTGD